MSSFKSLITKPTKDRNKIINVPIIDFHKTIGGNDSGDCKKSGIIIK